MTAPRPRRSLHLCAVVVCLLATVATATAASARPGSAPAVDPPPSAAPDGWVVTSQGGISAFGGAPTLAASGSLPKIASAAATPDGGGLWLLGDSGRVVAVGSATAFPGASSPPAGSSKATAIASTPAGDGVWVLSETGAIRALGAAGSMPAATVAAGDRAIALAANSAGTGLWVVTRLGRVVAVGAAAPLPSPTFAEEPHIVGFVPTPDGSGGWLVDRSGVVTPTGSAPAVAPPSVAATAATGLGSAGRLLTVAANGTVTQRSPQGSTLVTNRPVLGNAVAVVSPSGASPIAEPGEGLPATTKVIDPTLVLATSGDPAGTATVRVPRAAVDGRRGLRVGDIVATGIGPNTPFGLLRSVVAIAGPNGSAYDLATTPALLQDAVPQGSIDVETPQQSIALDPDPVVSVRPTGLTMAASSKGWECESEGEGGTPGSPVQVEVSGTIDLDLFIGFVFQLDWSALEPVGGKLGVGASAGFTFTGEATAALQCEREIALMEPRYLDPVQVLVAGVPVVIVPELGVNFTVTAGIAGAIEAEVSGSVSGEAGIRFGADGVHSYTERNATGDVEVGVGVSASVGAETELNTKALLYGIAGPQVVLTSPALELKVEACRTPVAKLELSGKLSATLALASWLGGDELPIALEETLYEFDLWTAPPTWQTPLDLCGSISPPTLAPVRVGQNVDVTLSADLPGTIEWELIDGALPAGLSLVPLANDAHIQGVPTAAGVSTFIVSAEASTGRTVTRQYTLSVLGASLSIVTDTLPAATRDVAYSTQLLGEGATEAVTWAIVDGSLPNGLSLNTGTGQISGTPTETGTFGFVVELAYASETGDVAQKALGIVVNEPPRFTGTVTLAQTYDKAPGSGCAGSTARCTLDASHTFDVEAMEVVDGGGFSVDATVSDYRYHYVVSFPESAGGSGCVIDVVRRALDTGSAFAYSGTIVTPNGLLSAQLTVEETTTTSGPPEVSCGSGSVTTRVITVGSFTVPASTMVVRDAEGKLIALNFNRTTSSTVLGLVTQTGRLDLVE